MASIRTINHLILVLTLLFLGGCQPDGPRTHHQVDLGGQEWNLELAIGDEAIRQGLMDRATVPPGTGMLFIFPRSEVHRFWMANCLVDIDAIFIDGAGIITAAYTMKTEPPRAENETEMEYLRRLPTYTSRYPVRAAIELPAGSIESMGLQVGHHTGLDMNQLERLRQEVVRERGGT